MAGDRIEIIVESSRLTKQYKQQYEPYVLNPVYVHIIETPEVSRRIKQEYNSKMRELYKKGFVPPKPSGF